jgi:hypothetical protein
MESLRIFVKNIIKKVYVWVTAIICGLPALLLPLFKPLLPINWQGYTKMIILFFVIIILIIIVASFQAFHELRMRRKTELYDFIPEAKRDRAFKVIYDLYKDGKMLQSSCAERQKKWDEEVISAIKKYFSDSCLMNYLIATNRIVYLPSYVPLDINKYNNALSYIKELLERDFYTYFKA